MKVRDTAVDRTAGFEVFVGYLYLDTKAKVTVGYGRMLPNADAATSIPLKKGGNDASNKEKRGEWTTMNEQEAGHVASYYKQFTSLTLDESDAKILLRENLTTAASDLSVRFA